MSNQLIRLEPSESVEGRPFTSPAQSLADASMLQAMAEMMGQFIQAAATPADLPRPFIYYLEEAGRRLHRLILVNPAALRRSDDLTVVGFCGQKRPHGNRDILNELDRELIAELPDFGDLLSYSTLELDNGDACNLVLFSRPQGIQHWARSQKHAQAVQMSPDFYESIRLHQGRLPGGLMSPGSLVLLRTKYYDYRDQPVWRAVRDLAGEEPASLTVPMGRKRE